MLKKKMKIIDFGDSFIVKDKISMVTKDVQNPKVLQVYFNHNIPITVNHSSKETRDEVYELIKKDFMGDD